MLSKVWGEIICPFQTSSTLYNKFNYLSELGLKLDNVMPYFYDIFPIVECILLKEKMHLDWNVNEVQ